MSLVSVRCTALLETGNKETTDLKIPAMCGPPLTKAAWSEYKQPSRIYGLSARPLSSPSVQPQDIYSYKTRKSFHQVELVKGQQFKVPTKMLSQAAVEFEILKDDKSSHSKNSVAHLITLKQNNLLEYVSDFANHCGGELYYGIFPNGIVRGEIILETEKEKVHENVEKKIASMMWPKHVGNIHKFWEITFLPVSVKDSAVFMMVKDCYVESSNLYVLKICVNPCHEGKVRVERSKGVKSFKIVDANKEWNKRHLPNKPLESLKHKWFEANIFKENAGMSEKFMDELGRLEWVVSFKIVDANKECDERHLEIVCKLGKVPRTCDIVNIFGGKDILPFITYKECSKREWFKTNILGKNSGRKKKYKNELASLSWVKDFYIGVASEPEKSWQIYITCAQNKVPSMADLKKLFGANIASFVDFIQDSNPNEESLPSPCLLRGPRTGDKLCVEVEDGRYPGTIGILSADEKHYATTCYHVCFKRDLPEDINEVHKILKNDCAKENSSGCQDANCVYRLTDEEERLLGQFCHGLYNDDHDIALIKLEPSLNCADAVKFLGQESIEPKLANIEEVDDMFYDMDGKVPVEKFGSATGITNGQLFAVDGGKQFISTDEVPCYRIKEIDGQVFAEKGDSGSLVYLLYNGKRIPFGYVSMGIPELKLYGCRNLLQSIKEVIHNIQPCLKDH